ncbi:NAD(P)-binding domain-containing protein [Pseudonocardia sp. H11422]|uniref:NAD(P)-binding domain-containing protein n=1 Tax=Pseudonocardia sp. H11422 TaxID=2835866 RepID=UPI001BDC78EB|nr:NAD(P)-binding domain-containing protein [Pseudonocardia sp. H11422]
MITRVQTLIVGAGQAGLAISRCLSYRALEHVVLERGRVGQRWRSERWDSFRLLTPNWFRDLPGHREPGADPAGFLGRGEMVELLSDYARFSGPSVQTGVTVTGVRPDDGGWSVRTDQGRFAAENVVIASGYAGRLRVPALTGALPDRVCQLHTSHYRNPDQLPDGGVLIVGSGPSGMQIADELARAGRRIHLSVGRHRALPRRYRGMDAFEWMDRMGMLTQTRDTISTTPWSPAPGAADTAGVDDIGLRSLVERGVRPLGRMIGVAGSTVHLGSAVAARVAEADAYHRGFRCAIDEHVRRHGLDAPVEELPPPPPWTATTPAELDLARAGIGTVLWATGFRQDYESWVHAAVYTEDGEPVHHRGATAAPGLFFLGLPWQHRRRSHTLGGVGGDAGYLAELIRTRAGSLVAA